MLLIGWPHYAAGTPLRVSAFVSCGAAEQGSAMVAPRSLRVSSEEERLPGSAKEAGQWMSLQQAASELGVSTSTVRRWILKGKLQSRIVARGRRFHYQVRVGPALEIAIASPAPTDIVKYLRSQLEAKEERLTRMEQDLKRQEEQIQNLSAGLARALQRNHGSEGSGNGPYAKYRWLARRRWWPFR